jgi:VanZ family protein
MLTVLVAFLSLIPGEPEEGDSQLLFAFAAVPSAFQNFMHLVVYATLAVSWSWALDAGHRRLAMACAWVIAYGVALELAQLAVPGRFSSLLDIALNTAGVALAALLISIGRRRLLGSTPVPGRGR